MGLVRYKSFEPGLYVDDACDLGWINPSVIINQINRPVGVTQKKKARRTLVRSISYPHPPRTYVIQPTNYSRTPGAYMILVVRVPLKRTYAKMNLFRDIYTASTVLLLFLYYTEPNQIIYVGLLIVSNIHPTITHTQLE